MNNYTVESEKIMQEVEDKIEKENRLQPILLSELMQKKFEPIKWLAEPLIPSESVVAISGSPASYKTWLILDLAQKVARGDLWLEYFGTQQTSVLMIDEENTERSLQDRFNSLNCEQNLPIHILSLKDFQLADDTIELVINYAKANDIKLIFFDSLVRIHNSDENDASKMAQVFKKLNRFRKEGITVIFTHHNRKQIGFQNSPSQDMRGSSDILASVDCHIAIYRSEDEITLKQTKLRQAEEFQPFKVKVIKDDNKLKFEFAGEADQVEDRKKEFKNAIIELLSQQETEMYKQEILNALKASGLKGGESTFKMAFQDLVKDQIIITHRGERNKLYCSIKPNSDETDLAEDAKQLFE